MSTRRRYTGMSIQGILMKDRENTIKEKDNKAVDNSQKQNSGSVKTTTTPASNTSTNNTPNTTTKNTTTNKRYTGMSINDIYKRERVKRTVSNIANTFLKSNNEIELEKGIEDRKKERSRLEHQIASIRSNINIESNNIYGYERGLTYGDRNGVLTKKLSEANARMAEYNKQLSEAEKALEKLKDEAKYDEYYTADYGEGFTDRFAANYSLGTLQEDYNQAWNEVRSDPTNVEKREKAAAVSAAMEDFTRDNQDALDDDGWISKSLAGYLPQLKNQSGSGLVGAAIGGVGGGIIGAVGGAITGSAAGGVGAVPGAIAGGIAGAKTGGKWGYGLGSADYSFETMSGAVYGKLIEEGYSHEIASAAAQDVGVVSGAIELLGTAIGFKTLGVDDLLLKAESATLKKIGLEVAEQGTKKALGGTIVKGVGGVALEGVSEYVEEYTQEAVDIANEERVKSGETGKLNLIGKSVDKLINASEEERAQMEEAGEQGLRIGLMLGGAGRVTTDTISYNIDRANRKQYSAIGKDIKEAESVDAVIETGLESNKDTASYKIAEQLKIKQESGKELTDAEVGQLFAENVKTIQQEERQNTPIVDEQETVQNEVPTQSDITFPQTTKTAQNANMVQRRTTGTATDVVSAISSLGDNGAKAVRTYFDGKQDFNEFYDGFTRYYEAGLSNVPKSQIKTVYANNITPAVREAAYMAGLNDREVSLKQDIENAKYATMYGKEAGFIKNDASNEMSQNDIEFYNELGKATGLKITMAEQVYNGAANGSFENGVVTIAKDAVNPFYVVAKHEVTHSFKKAAPTEYRAYRDYAVGLVASNSQLSSMSYVEQYKSKAASQGVNLTTDKAMDEIASDFTEHILKDKEDLKKFIQDNVTDNRTMVQKFFDTVREFINKVKKVFKGDKKKIDEATRNEFGATVAELEQAEKLWKEALQATKERAKEAKVQKETKADTKAGNTQYSLKDSEGRTLTEAQAEFFKDSKVRDENGNLLVMYHGTMTGGFNTFDIKQFGRSDKGWLGKGFYFTNDFDYADSYTKKLYSDESVEGSEVKEVYLNLVNPYIITDESYSRKPEALMNKLGAKNSEEVTKILKGKGYDGVLLQYEDDYGNNFVEAVTFEPNQIKEVTNTNPTANPDIRFSLKDSNGRELSEGQANFYEDNKLVDENGNLLTLYHGTKSDFTVFTPSKGGEFGPGIYLAEREDVARWYSKYVARGDSEPRVMEVYGVMKNPYTITKQEYIKKTERTTPKTFMNRLIKQGYDGIIGIESNGYDKQYIVFSPEQVKSVDNLNPTDSDDIRFSLKKPVEETKDLIAVHNLGADNLNKSLDLGGFPVPSIAITKAENEYGDFGDITLVFSKDTIDPDNPENEVYTRDVYSKTIPPIRQKITPAKLRELKRKFEPYFGEVDDSLHYKSDSKFTATNVEDLANDLAYEAGMKLAYLKETGKIKKFEPVYRKKRWKTDDITEEILQEFSEKYPETTQNDLPYDETMKYEEAVKDIIYKIYLPYDEKIAKEMADETGFRHIDNFLQDVRNFNNKNYQRTELDIYATRDKLKELAGNNDKEFINWIREQISPYYGEKYHDADGKKIEPNLSALTEYMKKGSTRATQKTMVYGMGNAVAESSKKLNSIKSIKEYSQNIKDSKTVDEIREAVEKLDETVREGIARSRITKGESFFDVFEDYYKALAQYMKNGKGLEAAFRKNYFDELTSKQITEIKYLAEQIQATPVTYFEAKPQRAVEFDEVLAAVVPKDTDANLKARLQEKGVNVIEYDSKVEGDRLRAVNSVEEAKFSLKGQSDILKENERLREYNEYLQDQMKLTKTIKTDKKALQKLSRDLLKEYNSELEQSTLVNELDSLYDFIANEVDSEGNKLAWDTLKPKAVEVAQKILSEATTLDDSMYEGYKHLRNYLKTTGISIAEDQRFTDFNDFRKANFGRIKITNDGVPVDRAYQELEGMYPEFFDSEQYMTQADQLYHIAEVLDSLRPVETNPYSYDIASATEWLANDLIERFYDVPQAKPTFADKQQAKMAKAQAKVASKFTKRIEKKDAKIKRLKAQAKEKVQATIAKEKANKQKATEKIKKHYDEKIANASDRRKKSATIKKIRKHYDALYKMIVKPTDTVHTPEFMRKPLADFLQDFNFTSSRTKLAGMISDYEARQMLDTVLSEDAFQGMDRLLDAYTQADESTYFHFDPDLISNLRQAKEAVKGIDRLADLSTAELENIYRVILAVHNSITGYNTAVVKGQKKDVALLSQLAHNEMGTLKSKMAHNNVISKVDNLINTDMLTPIAFFDGLGGSGSTMAAMYSGIREGMNKAIFNFRVGEDYINNVLKDVDIKEWTGEKATATEFALESGNKIMLTPAQVMSLYELVKRPQASKHVLGKEFSGGITPSKTDTKNVFSLNKDGDAKKIKAQLLDSLKSERVTYNDVQKILSTLTPEQKKVADAIQKFFSEVTSEWGNEVSMLLYGYKKFNDPYYFPIISDKRYVDMQAGITKDSTLINSGFTKAVQENASNPIMVEDIFDVYTRHMQQMANYNAFVIPLNDLQKIINFRGQGINIKEDITRIRGAKALTYIERLLRDINGGVRNEAGTEIARSLMRNYKTAAMGMNIRVILQQPTAIIRAAAVIDPKYLAKGIAKPAKWETIKKHSAISQWKDWGYYSLDIGRQMKDVLLGNKSFTDKAMWAIGKADEVAWVRMWSAVEYEIKDKYPDIKPNTDEFYKKVSERFDEIIDRTQVIDTVLHRSSIMRSNDTFAKMATSFMSEPTQSFNLMRNSLLQYNLNKSAENRNKAIRAITATVSSITAAALAAALVDLWRGKGDEDEEKDEEGNVIERTWYEKLARLTGANVIDNFAGILPYGRDVYNLASGWDVERLDMQGVSSVVKALKTLGDYVGDVFGEPDEEGNKPEPKQTITAILVSLAGGVGQVTGLPIKNTIREIESLVNGTFNMTDSYEAKYVKEKMFSNIKNSSNRKVYLDILYDALKADDVEAFKTIYNDMIDNEYIPASAIKSGMKARANKDKDVSADTITKNMLKAGITPTVEVEKEESNTYTIDNLSSRQLERYDNRFASDVSEIVSDFERLNYDDLDKETYSSLLSAATTYANKVALLEASGGKLVGIDTDGDGTEDKTVLRVGGQDYSFSYPNWIDDAQHSEELLDITTAEFLKLKEEYNVSTMTSEKAYNAVEAGVDIVEYLEFYEKQKDIKSAYYVDDNGDPILKKDGNIKYVDSKHPQSRRNQVMDLLDTMGLTQEEYDALMEAAGFKP